MLSNNLRETDYVTAVNRHKNTVLFKFGYGKFNLFLGYLIKGLCHCSVEPYKAICKSLENCFK